MRDAQNFMVLFDSGILTRGDVIRAITMDAQGVLCECRVSLIFAREMSNCSRAFFIASGVGEHEGMDVWILLSRVRGLLGGASAKPEFPHSNS